jgi:AcrR family transcriptional regulator
MNENNRNERRAAIQRVALGLLKEVGYRKTSMLQIAKTAQASNQTMYSWFGSKQDLFRSIIEDFGQAVRAHLASALNEHTDPLTALADLGPTLMRFTTDENAIIMNRAAVIDAAETGVLAAAIEEVGRSSIFPLICALMERLVQSKVFSSDVQAADAAQTYVALLFGEVQFRQALGTVPPFESHEIRPRSARAFELTCRLYSTPLRNSRLSTAV